MEKLQDDRTRMSFRMSKKVHREFKSAAVDAGMKLEKALEQAMIAWTAKYRAETAAR